MEKTRSIVLVTGASSGLGFAVARYLFEKGYTVYAGARSFKSENIQQKSEEYFYSVYLDVTDQASVDMLLEQIKMREGRLDVLVNCAAHLVLGSVEDTSIDEYRGVLETNFLGTLRMCKGVVPIMREQRSGLIINFSSINGVLGIPFQSAYVASKFAIEGFTESLSMEVKNYGIGIVMIEPGDHRSGSKNYRHHAKIADSISSPYHQYFTKVIHKIEFDETNGSYPTGLASLIYKITLKSKPKLRYTIGRLDQKFSIVLKKLLPGRLFEKIIYDYYNK